jgi:hypothetical protein
MMNSIVSATAEAEFCYLSFNLYRADGNDVRIEVISAFQILRRPPRGDFAQDGSVRVELYDADGRWLYSATCFSDNHTKDDASLPFRSFRVYFPEYPEWSSLNVVRDGKTIGRLTRAKSAPVIESFEAKSVDSHGKHLIRLSWKSHAEKAPNPALQYGVRFTNDRKNWRALGACLTSDSIVVDAKSLPGGAECVFQLVASAGLRSATKEVVVSNLPSKAREVYILSPKADETFEAGEPIRFAGTAFSSDSRNCRADELVWTSLPGGTIGVGQQVTTRQLRAGFHSITLHAPDGMGGMVSQSVAIRITPKKESSQRTPTGHLQKRKNPCGCRG